MRRKKPPQSLKSSIDYAKFNDPRLIAISLLRKAYLRTWSIRQSQYLVLAFYFHFMLNDLFCITLKDPNCIGNEKENFGDR
jgi:hypothetical protein